MRMPLVSLLAVIALGCGGTASPSPVSPAASVTPAPTDTPAPATPTPKPSATPQPSATPGPTQSTVFASTVYPYTLELPPGSLTRNWKRAVVPWDGQARIYTESRSVDITGTVNGGLLIFGLPWEADLPSFAQLVRDNAARFNGCTALEELRQFDVDGVAGLGQRQHCLETDALYFVLVRDGLGLGFRMRDYLEPETVLDELSAWLGEGLTWTTP